jgi:hypothetical protein
MQLSCAPLPDATKPGLHVHDVGEPSADEPSGHAEHLTLVRTAAPFEK